MTTTWPSIWACCVPQNSAQRSAKLPVAVGRNHSVSSVAGTTSCFSRKAGMKKLWMTSCEARTRRTVLADRHMQRIDLPLSAGVLNFPHPLLADDIEFEIG